MLWKDFMRNLACIFFHFMFSYQACNNVNSFPDLTFVFDHGVKFKLSGE